jgi:hypothetical protein
MGWMGMIMGPMVSGVIVVVHALIFTMGVVVGMFMLVLMAMEMLVLVGVDFLPVPVFMGVYMGVLVGMPVLVFMGAFHIKPSFVDCPVGSCGEETLKPLSVQYFV